MVQRDSFPLLFTFSKIVCVCVCVCVYTCVCVRETDRERGRNIPFFSAHSTAMLSNKSPLGGGFDGGRFCQGNHFWDSRTQVCAFHEGHPTPAFLSQRIFGFPGVSRSGTSLLVGVGISSLRIDAPPHPPPPTPVLPQE